MQFSSHTNFKWFLLKRWMRFYRGQRETATPIPYPNQCLLLTSCPSLRFRNSHSDLCRDFRLPLIAKNYLLGEDGKTILGAYERTSTSRMINQKRLPACQSSKKPWCKTKNRASQPKDRVVFFFADSKDQKALADESESKPKNRPARPLSPTNKKERGGK